MERFHNLFDHPHKFIVHGRWEHALCHKVANGRRGAAETERKHCRGAPYVVFWREGSSSGKSCHVIGVGKGEVALVFPGLLGSQRDTKLVLKPLVVEADGGERLDGGMSQCQLSSHRDDEVQVTEVHVYARDLADSMASHPWPDVNVGTCKGLLPGAPTIGVSSKHQRVNLYYCAFGPDGVLKDTRFILVRAECPYVQFATTAHVISTERFIVRVTNRRERDMSQVSDGKVEGAWRA